MSPELISLRAALVSNAEQSSYILMNTADTTFVGTSFEIPEDEVFTISAIKDVATHY